MREENGYEEIPFWSLKVSAIILLTVIAVMFLSWAVAYYVCFGGQRSVIYHNLEEVERIFALEKVTILELAEWEGARLMQYRLSPCFMWNRDLNNDKLWAVGLPREYRVATPTTIWKRAIGEFRFDPESYAKEREG